MENNLKTLKDLELHDERDKWIIREKAVKWRKHFFIMDERVFDEFFNITVEDLK